MPIFWIHYEGEPPGSLTLEKSIDRMTELVRLFASQNPILTDADRAFNEMLVWLGKKRRPNRSRELLAFDFRSSVNQCTKTGVTRMVGIALRRGGKFDAAERVLNAALSLATTNEERSAILQELSLLHQQIGGGKLTSPENICPKLGKPLGINPIPGNS